MYGFAMGGGEREWEGGGGGVERSRSVRSVCMAQAAEEPEPKPERGRFNFDFDFNPICKPELELDLEPTSVDALSAADRICERRVVLVLGPRREENASIKTRTCPAHVSHTST
jgi:hypothetical protein